MKLVETTLNNFQFEENILLYDIFPQPYEVSESDSSKSFPFMGDASFGVPMGFTIEDFLNLFPKNEEVKFIPNKIYNLEKEEQKQDKEIKIIDISKNDPHIEEAKNYDSINLSDVKGINKVKNNDMNLDLRIIKENGIVTKNESTKSTKLFTTKLFNNEIILNGKKHDCFSEDNLSIKIKSHFLNFSVDFSNELFLYLKTNYVYFNEIEQKFKEENIPLIKFFKLNHEYKTYDKKKEIKTHKSKTSTKKQKNHEDYDLKGKTLGSIINQRTSSKIKHKDKKNNNQKIYKAIIERNELLKEIFSVKYETLLKIYYRNAYTINISELGLDETILGKYGLNQEISLSKNIKMFKDLIENNSTCKDFIKKNNYDLAEYYKIALKNCMFKRYLPNARFLLKAS
jgi:hypothetical protein